MKLTIYIHNCLEKIKDQNGLEEFRCVEEWAKPKFTEWDFLSQVKVLCEGQLSWHKGSVGVYS